MGLLAAATWGAADFAGGLATRRADPSRVVLIAHGLSVLLLGAAAWRVPANLSPWAIAGGLLSGIAGSAALMVFYRALSIGVMGLAAALAGLLTAVIPVLVALETQGAPSPTQLLGFAVAAASIVLIAYAPAAPGTAPTTRRALVLATVAGIGFGLQLIFLHLSVAAGVSSQPASTVTGNPPAAMWTVLGPVLWALLLSRLGGVTVALGVQLWSARFALARALSAQSRSGKTTSATASALDPAPNLGTTGNTASVLGLAALAGLLDTTGNGLYMVSSLSGRLDVAAVLSSLYPGATILLAALVLKERATRFQLLGMALALIAVALIAA